MLDKALRTQRLFVVGGLQFVIEMGLAASWLNDTNRRREAIEIMRSRGWLPILESLGSFGRDPEDNVLGQDTINRLYRTMPPIARDAGGLTRVARPQSKDLWDGQLLRLRKAIEFIALVEAVVRERFRNGESLNRFRSISGQTVSMKTADEDAARVWEHLWIEPVLYQVTNRPRGGDVRAILANDRIVAQFRSQSMQGLSISNEEGDRTARGVLYWALRGATGKWRTIHAAANVVDEFYQVGEPSQAVTFDPNDFIDRIPRRPRHESESTFEHIYEDLLELGPATPGE